ncbi:MAG: hypothetical protein WC549_07560 [Actinomycetota bacterium]
MVKKQPQLEFSNTPERTELGKKAVEYLNLKDDKKKLQAKIDKAKEELIQLFIKENKISIRIEGTLVSYAHTEKNKIIIKQAI